ncbi:MAG: ABC transporter ATP-binding protein, partial [Alphaproteobacteria bacterium]|nr:ABC transporter ATP-binding protein [Alphaproteobacteria bacterium]
MLTTIEEAPADPSARLTRSKRIAKLLSYYRPYRGWLAADIGSAFVVAITTLLLPLVANALTRRVLAGAAVLDQLWLFGGAMLALVGVQALSTMIVDYRGHLMGAKIEADMRRELFAHYQKLSFSFFDRNRTGQLISRITNDLFNISELMHHGPEDLMIALLKFIGAFAILWTIDIPLSIAVFLYLPVMAAFGLYFAGQMGEALRISRERIGDINERAEDSLAGIRVVKSFTNEAAENARFAAENWRFIDSRGAGYRSEANFDAGMKAFPQLITITVIVLGALGLMRTSLDAAGLVTYLLCVAIMIDPIQRLVNFARLWTQGVSGFDRFLEMLDVAPDIADRPSAVDLPRAHGHITFRNVSFRYAEGTRDVFRNLSLEIQPGEFVALVGASGVGKTTLCALIPRFYDITAGSIALDGTDIRDLRLDALRRNIGVVQQDVYLFAGTVAENLRYGRADASKDELIAAAKAAHAHDFIMALPNGYHTDIGQRGVKL